MHIIILLLLSSLMEIYFNIHVFQFAFILQQKKIIHDKVLLHNHASFILIMSALIIFIYVNNLLLFIFVIFSLIEMAILPVIDSHTIIDVRTVMVKLYNASVTDPTVFGT